MIINCSESASLYRVISDKVEPNHTTHEPVEIAEFPDGAPPGFRVVELCGYICIPQASSSFNVSVN